MTKLLACLVLVTGCMATVNFEPRNLPTRAHSPAEACYQRKRVELTTARARWQYSAGGSYNAFTGVSTQVIVSEADSGLAFHQNGDRLELDAALQRLGDPELVRAHGDRVAQTSGSSAAYKLSRMVFVAMAAGGLAMMGVATAQVATDKHLADKGLGDFPLLWIGTAVAVGSIIPGIAMAKTYHSAVEHSIDTRIVRSELYDRTAEAVRAHNRRVMADCGFEGGEELPISPRLRASIR
ncbi:MAG: hypothetical protein ABI867_23040 [Kofleriaceae bacterium]